MAFKYSILTPDSACVYPLVLPMSLTYAILFTQFGQSIQTYCGLNEAPDVHEPDFKLSLVVVGPLDSDRKLNTGEQVIHSTK